MEAANEHVLIGDRDNGHILCQAMMAIIEYTAFASRQQKYRERWCPKSFLDEREFDTTIGKCCCKAAGKINGDFATIL